MAGTTVPDGFKYETVTDPPGVSQRAEAGTTLAEQVQAKFVTTDSSLAALEDRIAALENGTGGVGWIPIAKGTSSGASLTIDLTAGGKFPSPPLWDEIRVSMKIDLSDVAYINCRVNGDTDLVYRSGSFVLDSQNPASIDSEGWHFASGSQGAWVVARMATISTNTLDMRIFDTATNPGLLAFQSTYSRQSDDASTHRNGVATGALTSAKTATSLVFLPSAPQTFIGADWVCEGLRMTAP